jgi:hypothetical protein
VRREDHANRRADPAVADYGLRLDGQSRLMHARLRARLSALHDRLGSNRDEKPPRVFVSQPAPDDGARHEALPRTCRLLLYCYLWLGGPLAGARSPTKTLLSDSGILGADVNFAPTTAF